MPSSLGQTVKSWWGNLSEYVHLKRGDNNGNNEDEAGNAALLGEETDPSIWYTDLAKHFLGDFSFAAVQANKDVEDYGQVETGKNATFAGVYDGHGSPEAARFIAENLFNHLIQLALNNGTRMSEDVISQAFGETETGFLAIVRESFPENQEVAKWGSCCLVGVIWEGALYVANLGDSRAVMGSLGRKILGREIQSTKVFAKQLTEDHNACMKDVREELRASHRDDPKIVLKDQNDVWRVKGIIQVSRSIGDFYLKSQEFALDASHGRFHIEESLSRPVLRADPSISKRLLQPGDKFLIFATDGLWNLLTNQEAVDIVSNNRRQGIARRLIRSALHKAARKIKLKNTGANRSAGKTKFTYDDLKKSCSQDDRRVWHDDITVAVIFIDHEILNNDNVPEVAEMSFRAFDECTSVPPSRFRHLTRNEAESSSRGR